MLEQLRKVTTHSLFAVRRAKHSQFNDDAKFSIRSSFQTFRLMLKFRILAVNVRCC